MRILHDFAKPGQRAKALSILLPGALQQPEDFMQAGFIDAVRNRGLSIDLALVDFGMQYIGESTDGTALQQLHNHLLQPILSEGYGEIWLAGISIGGFIAIAYADRYPGQVDGLCLLAPYPGNRIVTREIEAVGGISQWRPDCVAQDDAERRVWRWLKMHREMPAAPAIHLGYGREDRFAPGNRLMAEALAAPCTDSVAGGHDWLAWRQLWENFLDREASRFVYHDKDKKE